MYTHAEILKKLSPYANKGWINRFKLVEKRVRKDWLAVVQSIDISHPLIEIIVEDIVKDLGEGPKWKNPVRREMEKLESEGKLKLDDPETEKYWQDKIDLAEREHQEWLQNNDEAVKRQRAADLQHIQNTLETNEIPVRNIHENPIHQNNMKELKQKVKQELETLPEPPAPKPEFTPQPPKAQAKETQGPKIKKVVADGKEVYNEEKDGPVQEGLEKLDLSKEIIESLNKHGIMTMEDFTKMDKVQAKQILGNINYEKHKALIT